MAEFLKCVFCGETDINLILFTEETLKKCKLILKCRKEHNLKHKDVTLPDELFESGYHRHCYKSFTGLMKKYYVSKSTTAAAAESNTSTDKSSDVTETTSSSVPNLATQCIESQSHFPQPSTSTSTLPEFSSISSTTPDSIRIPEPAIIVDLEESVAQNVNDKNLLLDDMNSTSESNVSIDSDVNIEKKMPSA